MSSNKLYYKGRTLPPLTPLPSIPRPPAVMT